MTPYLKTSLLAAVCLGLGAGAGIGQEGRGAASLVAEAEQDPLSVAFDTGSAAIRSSEESVIDEAARLFRAGSPYVMILAGNTDTTGSADVNLPLSARRSLAVADALADRGIPRDRLQVIGLGTTSLPEETGDGVSSQANRVVQITWR